MPLNELYVWVDPITPFADQGNPEFDIWESGAPVVDVLGATGIPTASGAGALSGQAVLTGAGTVFKSAAGALSGQAVLTGAGTVFKIGAGALSGQAVLIGAGAIVVPGVVNGAGSLSGFAVLAGAATVKSAVVPVPVPPVVPFEQIQNAVSLLSNGLSFTLLLDVLRFRRVKLDYVSPAICELAIQSGSSSGLMVFMESD
jgi:hypothetical protein